MKSHTSAGKLSKSYLGETKVFKEEFEGDPALNYLLQHIETQDWPNLIIGQVADRGRVVRATKVIEKGTYVCHLEGPLLEPDACKTFWEKAEAHSNDPELGQTEY